MKMLAKQGIVTEEERDAIIGGLTGHSGGRGERKACDHGGIRGYSQLCGGQSDRPDWRCGQKAAHRKKPERPGGRWTCVCMRADQVQETDGLLKELLETLLTDHGRERGDVSCRALPICRRPSPSLWPIISARILRCSSGIDGRLHDIYRADELLSAGSRRPGRHHLSAGSGVYGRTSGLLRPDHKQHGFCVRPGLSALSFWRPCPPS